MAAAGALHSNAGKIPAALAGGTIGLLILHPYTMVVYRILLDPRPLSGFMEIWYLILHSFALHMWPMSSFFLVFGALLGYGAGALWEKREVLLERDAEIKQRKAVQETLQEITLAVAHWIRNTNTLIGGMARRLIEKPSSGEELHTLNGSGSAKRNCACWIFAI